MKKFLFRLAGGLVLGASLLLGWLWMDYRTFLVTPLNVSEEGFELLIVPGTALQQISRRLEQEGVIANARYFAWMARVSGQAARIQAGEYRIDPGTTPATLLDQLVEGKVVYHGLTVLEGWNFRQLREALQAHPTITQTLHGLSNAEVMARIGHADEHPEGRFLPETYHFPRGLTDVAFLQRAYRAMAERLDYEWSYRKPDLPLKNSYEALILASIIEKETGVPEERATIAGVFTRRLLKRMRLQTDPTVIYGMGDAFDGNIRRRDLGTDTPYNTYRRRGLPPTPIALPGADAIHAAVQPEEGDVLYFVARGDGSHHFSATLEEHNRAVVRYQLKGRARPFSSSSPKE